MRERLAKVVRGLSGRKPAAHRWVLSKNVLSLTFEYVPRAPIAAPDVVPQSPRVEGVGMLFADIEELYWLALPPAEKGHSTDDPRLDEELAPRVVAVHFGSPFQVLVELPPYVWAGAVAGFVGALATVFGAPYKAGAKFHTARAEYWRSRLEADSAKSAWIASRRDAHAKDGFRLKSVKFPPGEDV